MREELDRALCKKYPEMFKHRHADPRLTPMAWGFDCGDGWYNLIDNLCATIHSHEINVLANRLYDKVEPNQPVVCEQVKEKFGGLRFYYMNGDEFVHGAVALAERLSYTICEECGNKGKVRGGGWIRTLCDEHAKVTSS